MESQRRGNGLKKGSLWLPEVFVNNVYFERKERATLESGEWLKGGVFTQQGLEFEPG